MAQANPPDPAEEDGVAAAFLVELLHDRERGAVRSRSDYQARYPGFEHVIAREFDELQAGVDGPADLPVDDDAGPRYRIEQEVGRGGMGTVYRAFERRFRRTLALKKSRQGAGPSELQRFVEEARVTAQLHHPGIVPVHDFGVDQDGQLFFTMDLVRGRTFAELLREPDDGAPLWQQHLDVLQRVCEAVAFAHSKGVVHRDLKPANIMVGRFGEVYVMDWGLARCATESTPPPARERDDVGDSVVLSTRDDDTPAWTMQGDVVGTPAYMAPEQARGGAVDGRADVYAIGAMLYERIAGGMPFGGEIEQPSSRLILERLVAGPPLSLAELRPDAPPELVAICDQAMHREPDQRYQDVLALRDDLRAFGENRVVGAYESGSWAVLRKWMRRNRVLAASVVLAVASLAVGLAVSLAQTTRAEQAATRATESLHDAVDAIERMLTNVGSRELDAVPNAVPIRRKLLDDATELFEQLLARNPHDAEVREKAAEAYQFVGRLLGRMGDREAQDAAYRRSLALRQALLDERPGDRELLHAIARTSNDLGHAAQQTGQYDRAIAHYDDALASSTQLLADARTAPALYLAATLQKNLGILTYERRDVAAAAEHTGNAAALHAEIRALGCEDYRREHATLQTLRGAVLRLQEDEQGTRKAWQAAADEYAALYADTPDDVELQMRYAGALSNLSIAHFELDELDAAVRVIRGSVRLRREHADSHPELVDSWLGLTKTLNNLAQYQRSNKDLDGAAATSREGIEAVHRALAMDPGSSAARNSAFLVHRNLHRATVHLRQHRELAANARRLAALEHADRGALRNAAHWLVACGRCVDDEAQRERYLQEALALLERVHARGELLPSHLDHRDLRSVRSHPGFQDLRRRAEK